MDDPADDWRVDTNVLQLEIIEVNSAFGQEEEHCPKKHRLAVRYQCRRTFRWRLGKNIAPERVFKTLGQPIEIREALDSQIVGNDSIGIEHSDAIGARQNWNASGLRNHPFVQQG